MKKKRVTDRERIDFLQSLCPRKNKTDHEFNLAWTSFAGYYGGHVAVRGRNKTFYRNSIRAALDAAIRSSREGKR